jgi:hypothetical protein
VRLKKRRGDGTEGALREAQAILSGRAVEWFEERNTRIPAWAWVNVLAHATPVRLRQLVAIGHYAHPSSWDCTLGASAAELVTAGCTPVGILRLQREALVPLELDLLAGRTASPSKPSQLTVLIRKVMQQRHAWPEP